MLSVTYIQVNASLIKMQYSSLVQTTGDGVLSHFRFRLYGNLRSGVIFSDVKECGRTKNNAWYICTQKLFPPPIKKCQLVAVKMIDQSQRRIDNKLKLFAG